MHLHRFSIARKNKACRKKDTTDLDPELIAASDVKCIGLCFKLFLFVLAKIFPMNDTYISVNKCDF